MFYMPLMPKLLPLTLLIASIYCQPVFADGPTGDVGGGVAFETREPTASRYVTRPVPYFDLTWGDVDLASDDGLAWHALRNGALSVGPYVNYLPGRSSEGPLNGMHDVHDMADTGLFVEYAPQPWVRVFARLGEAIGSAGKQGGTLAQVGGELDYPLGNKAFGSTQLVAHYADQRLTQTFFGVDTQESQATGISAYHASGGWQNVTLSQGGEYSLDDHWKLLGGVSWIHLAGSAADSSIVQEKGHVNQGMVQTAVSYHF